VDDLRGLLGVVVHELPRLAALDVLVAEPGEVGDGVADRAHGVVVDGGLEVGDRLLDPLGDLVARRVRDGRVVVVAVGGESSER